MNTSRKSIGHRYGLNRRNLVVASAASAALAAVLASSSALAASGNWLGSPTTGNWEDNANWSGASFPGTTPPASPAISGDVATFNAISSITTIAINSTSTPNSNPLNIASMTFTGTSLSSYTIGSTTGNSLVFTANASRKALRRTKLLSPAAVVAEQERPLLKRSILLSCLPPRAAAQAGTIACRITQPTSPASAGWTR